MPPAVRATEKRGTGVEEMSAGSYATSGTGNNAEIPEVNTRSLLLEPDSGSHAARDRCHW